MQEFPKSVERTLTYRCKPLYIKKIIWVLNKTHLRDAPGVEPETGGFSKIYIRIYLSFFFFSFFFFLYFADRASQYIYLNPLNTELNPICQ